MNLILTLCAVLGLCMPLNGESIRAVIFDCDGTLVDSEYSHYLAWRYALQKQGSDLALEDYHLFVGKPGEKSALFFAEQLGKDCADELIKDKRDYFFTLLLAGVPPIEATVDFVHRLAKEKETLGLKLAIASAAKREEIKIHLKNLKIEEYFDVIVSGQNDLGDYCDPEGTNKPKPYVYLQTAKVLGVDPSECVVIEDSQPGVVAAADAGCLTIAVPNAFTVKQDLSRAHIRLESFENMSVADFFQMHENVKWLKEAYL